MSGKDRRNEFISKAQGQIQNQKQETGGGLATGNNTKHKEPGTRTRSKPAYNNTEQNRSAKSDDWTLNAISRQTETKGFKLKGKQKTREANHEAQKRNNQWQDMGGDDKNQNKNTCHDWNKTNAEESEENFQEPES